VKGLVRAPFRKSAAFVAEEELPLQMKSGQENKT
jgi:hypothetical protein